MSRAFDPVLIFDWADERHAAHQAERREAIAARDRESAALAVGQMLELLELKSFLIKQGVTQPSDYQRNDK